MASGHSARVLIDKALEFSGWNLLDHKQVQLELNVAGGREHASA